jgi:hypothetical protein
VGETRGVWDKKEASGERERKKRYIYYIPLVRGVT